MYISNLKLRNWRNFTDVDIDLKETVYIRCPARNLTSEDSS